MKLYKPIISAGLCLAAVSCGDEADPPAAGSVNDDRNDDFGLPDLCRGTPLPDDQHFSAAGTCARLVADDQGPIRQITFAPNGDLFGVTSDGMIRRYRDANDNGAFDAEEIVEWASTGGMNGNNVHIDAEGGFLYAGSPEGVKRWKWTNSIDRGEDPEDVITGQPSNGTHKLHTVHVWDGWLYVHSGSLDNFVAPMLPEYDTERSVIKRFNLSEFDGRPWNWSRGGEVFAVGLRNAVGFTRNEAGKMFAVVNGIDDLIYQGRDIHNDNPGEQVVELEQGGRYGYPYCFTAQMVTAANGEPITPGTQLMANIAKPEFTNPHDNAWCQQNSTPPVSFVQAHTAPLDLVFFENTLDGLPARWRGGAFIALHGSWDRDPPTGYKVVWLPFDSEGSTKMPTLMSSGSVTFPYEVVFGAGTKEAHVDQRWGWSSGGAGETSVRPVGVAISPIDGALYVSSDNAPVFGLQDHTPNGAIYRIGKTMSVPPLPQ